MTVLAMSSGPDCARVCARLVALLLYPAREPLNHEFEQFTWENAVELMCDEKQRNRENLNLSPLRLPFRHIGFCEYTIEKIIHIVNFRSQPSRSFQQIRGSCSPESMSTTRVPPMRVFIMTKPG